MFTSSQLRQSAIATVYKATKAANDETAKRRLVKIASCLAAGKTIKEAVAAAGITGDVATALTAKLASGALSRLTNAVGELSKGTVRGGAGSGLGLATGLGAGIGIGSKPGVRPAIATAASGLRALGSGQPSLAPKTTDDSMYQSFPMENGNTGLRQLRGQSSDVGPSSTKKSETSKESRGPARRMIGNIRNRRAARQGGNMQMQAPAPQAATTQAVQSVPRTPRPTPQPMPQPAVAKATPVAAPAASQNNIQADLDAVLADNAPMSAPVETSQPRPRPTVNRIDGGQFSDANPLEHVGASANAALKGKGSFFASGGVPTDPAQEKPDWRGPQPQGPQLRSPERMQQIHRDIMQQSTGMPSPLPSARDFDTPPLRPFGEKRVAGPAPLPNHDASIVPSIISQPISQAVQGFTDRLTDPDRWQQAVRNNPASAAARAGNKVLPHIGAGIRSALLPQGTNFQDFVPPALSKLWQ